jgi:tyrosine-protein kinase Etk/Wzc
VFEQVFETRAPSGAEVVPDVRRSIALDAGGGEPEEGVDPRRYAAAILRHRWWVLGLTGLGILGGIGGARMVRPSYQVQATIWIQSSDPRGANSRGPIGNNQLFDSYAWVDLMRSYVVLDQVARDLRLYISPAPGYHDLFATFGTAAEYRAGRFRLLVDRAGQGYRLLDAKGNEVDAGTVGDSVGRALGFVWAPAPAVLPAGTDVAFTVRSLRDAAKGIANDMTIAIDPNGNFLKVSLTGQDGGRAATIVNAVARRYVEVATELKRAKLGDVARLLQEQLAAASAGLQRAESAFDAFKVRTITLAPDAGAGNPKGGGAPAVGEFFNLKLEQEQLARDQAAIEQVLEQARDSAGAIGALAFLAAVQHTPDLDAALRELSTKRAERRALLYGYTEDHPSVRRVTAQIDELERATIPSMARALADEFAARQRALRPRIAAGSRDLQEIPQRTIDEARLRRDLDLATGLYTSVQQRLDEARLAEASSIADVRVLDAAVAPQDPLQDRSSRLIVMGFVAGLGMGLVGAILVDRFDPRMRYPVQVTRQMGLPILGVVPHVKDRAAGPDDEHVAHAIEAMRGVRLNVTHAYGPTGPVLLTITSPGSGDGKSLVSANLALAFAEVGQKTILIDGDVRRGGLHHALRLTRRPGLTDLLAGGASLESVVQHTSWPALDFIATGTRFRDAPELLASPAMGEMVERLRATYQVVLFDSPPLGAGVDPYTLGAATGNLVLVLRTGTTNLEFARTKLAQLDYLPIRLLGAIVNDVEPGGVYKYYSYLSGYGTADEGTALPTHRLRGVL